MSGPVTGWRAFGIEDGNLARTMGNWNHGAPPGLWQAETEALCWTSKQPKVCTPPLGRRPLSVDGSVPGEHCRCGLYAFRDLDDLLRRNYLRTGTRPKAAAQVQLEGKVIVGKPTGCGYELRGERARIVSLYALERDRAVAEPVAARLGVPIEFVSRWESLPETEAQVAHS